MGVGVDGPSLIITVQVVTLACNMMACEDALVGPSKMNIGGGAQWNTSLTNSINFFQKFDQMHPSFIQIHSNPISQVYRFKNPSSCSGSSGFVSNRSESSFYWIDSSLDYQFSNSFIITTC